MNDYGSERKLLYDGYFADDAAEQMSRISENVHPVVLNVTGWVCRAPWKIQERRICDNFLLFVEDGEVRASVRGEERILRRGDGIIVPEFEPHSVEIAEGCESCSHLICHAMSENLSGENPFACFDSPFITLTDPDAALRGVKRIAALFRHHPDSAAEYMSGWLLCMMADTAETGSFRLKMPGCRDERILQSLKFIRENFRSDIGVDETAAHSGLGEVRFRSLFKEGTGMTPAACLLRFRLLYAACLLARSNYTIQMIAEQSGFSSAAYFCTAFRQMFQCSPNDYRNLILR